MCVLCAVASPVQMCLDFIVDQGFPTAPLGVWERNAKRDFD